jgi:hypothetical protein
VTVVARIEALVSAGQPVETAIVAVASRGVGAPLVDEALAAAAGACALGAPLLPALAHEAGRVGLDELARFGADLDRARDLGQGRADGDRRRAQARSRRRARP